MLAQGQSSPAKRGGLAADVSSGLIFLQKKKKKNEKGESDVIEHFNFFLDFVRVSRIFPCEKILLG